MQMRATLTSLTLSALLAGLSHAEQSASFRSQATQGFAWQGLASVTFERLDITVHSDHLDVEHELGINATTAGWGVPSQANSLEILGELTLTPGSVVTGLLLWNGNILLKGKLHSNVAARRQYEDVVDRNVTNPPAPRDPAILEKTGADTYALSIFPVALNGSRRIRLRYLVPSAFVGGAHRMEFPHAFSRVASVTVRGGPGTLGYALTSVRADESEATVKNEDAVETPVELDPEAFRRFLPYLPWEAGSGAWLRHITPLFGASKASRVSHGQVRDAKGMISRVAHYFFRPPPAFTDLSPGGRVRIVAAITDGVDTVEKEITGDSVGLKWAEELRILSRAELEPDITWKLYAGDSIAEKATETPLRIEMADGNQFARSFGGKPFYPLAKSMPPSLAAAWGFVDSKYSLLALEKDSLPAALAARYAAAGVPALEPGEIYPEDGLPDSIPLSVWMLRKNLDRDALLRPISVLAGALPPGIRWRFRDGLVVVEIDRAALARGVAVSLHGLDGRLLKRWGSGDVSGGRLSWSPREAAYGAGVCLLRIDSGKRTYSARVVLR